MALETHTVPIDELFEDPDNERLHPEKNIDAIRKSIERFGQVEPLVVRRDSGCVLGGNGRLRVLRELKRTEVEVVYFDGTDDEASALRIALNRTAELATWDGAALLKTLGSLQDGGFNIEFAGFEVPDFKEVQVKNHRRTVKEAKDPGPGEIPDTPESQLGEVYSLGPHVLVCGDSLDPLTWDKFKGPITGVWTDPPYGVSYVGGTDDHLTIQNDSLNNDELAMFLRKVFTIVLNRVEPGSPFYCAAPCGDRSIPFANTIYELGLFRQRLIWVKNSLVLGRSDYHWRHEDIYYGFVPGSGLGRLGRGGKRWFGDNSQDTVFNVDKPSANRDHPTMKPVELILRCFKNSFGPDAVVVDPFGGSGSTLIAAAQHGVESRLIELDPRYADVIRRRWGEWARSAGVDPGPGAL